MLPNKYSHSEEFRQRLIVLVIVVFMQRKNSINFIGLIVAIAIVFCLGDTFARALNPICPPGVYIADLEARQMPDGRVYVYGSRDEAPDHYCSHSYDVPSSSDLVNWKHDQLSFATSGDGKQTDYTQS